MKKAAIVVIGIVILLALVFLFLRKNESNEFNGATSIQVQSNEKQAPAKEATAAMNIKTYNSAPPVLEEAEIKGKVARIRTSKGDIVFELFEDAPKAASNFIFLTNDGFYKGLTFHRREEGFVIQGGDPNGDGTGGPGYKFADEPVSRDYKRGIVAMANSGPNTNGSQFFIMLDDNADLPKKYTIFGNVTSGMDVVDQIKIGDLMEEVTVE